MNNELRVAILIVAHKGQKQLDKLIEQLKPSFNLYIHLDKKSQLIVNETENVKVIKDYKVYWGSREQILVTKKLLELAVKDKNDWYLLISGQDIPLCSNSEIIQRLSKEKKSHFSFSKLIINNPKINKLVIDDMTSLKSDVIRRLALFHFNIFRRENNLRSKILAKFQWFIHAFQKRFGFYRVFPQNVRVGSNWFNLTHEAVEVLLQNLTKKTLRRYKFTSCADEIFVQTILLNSKLKNKCINNDLRLTDLDYEIEETKIYTVSDIEQMLNSKKLFARKVDEEKDIRLINKIYELVGI